ncbi:MAG: hypothetical protein IPJ77_12830 [Planctomycetes bacterium]|nr:hypothetical protein [Planctomycetota bacterium]
MTNNTWKGAALALALLSGAAHAQAWQVTITELPLLPGGTYSSAYAISDTGTIVGVANDASGALKSVRWTNGEIAVLPELSPSVLGIPSDVNSAGEICGTYDLGFDSAGIAWDSAGTPAQLPGLPGQVSSCRTSAINAGGLIAGFATSSTPNPGGHAVLWLGNTLQVDLGFMGGGNYSEALGLNDLGQVVGLAGLPNGHTHAFRWQNGVFTDVGAWPGGGAVSKAYAINASGVMVGLNANVASIWQNGTIQPLPMPPGSPPSRPRSTSTTPGTSSRRARRSIRPRSACCGGTGRRSCSARCREARSAARDASTLPA